MLNLRFPHLAPLCRWLVLAALAGVAVPAHASLMLPPAPFRPKDFTVVKKDGLFHIFYIRHDSSKPELENEKDFGHAVSADMYSWTQLPPVIPVRPSGWDNQYVWAPTIVLLDSVYYMIYTGVTQRPGAPGREQRLGLATSTDLMTWNRLDQPIYSCRDVPWAWCDTLTNANGFRDPFVMPNPSAPGRWLMYYSAFPASDTAGMVVGVAGSDGDLTHWSNLMPLWVTNRQYSYSSIIESPHLFKHGNLWFLFVTMNSGQPLTFFTTPDPTGPLEQWTSRGRLGTMLGIDTNAWYASEYFADGTNDYFAFVQYNRVEMYKMFWSGPTAFHLFEPGNFHIQSMRWSADSVTKGNPATLSVVATGWQGRELAWTAAEKKPDGSESPLDLGLLQIPATLPLTADTTRFVWTSTIRHASGDTTGTERVVLRANDLTAEAKPITVVPPPPPPPPFGIVSMGWSADSAHVGDPVTFNVVAISWSGQVARLAAIERVPKGAELALNADSMGLPTALPLVADTTQFTWTARIRRDTGDTTSVLRLMLQNPEFETESPVLRITPRPPFVVRNILWSADSVEAGQPVTLSVAASGWNGHTLALEARERLPGGGEGPVAIASLGLPSELTLTADTTRVVWTTRIRRASGDTTTAQALVVRATNAGAASTPLRVTPAPGRPMSNGDPDPPPTQDRRLMFRALHRSVLGEQPAFLVDMPHAARVRFEVYDLQGRRVRTLTDRDLAAGANVLEWDGRDANGAALGRGLYFARISTPFASRTVKVVLTRPAGAP